MTPVASEIPTMTSAVFPHFAWPPATAGVKEGIGCRPRPDGFREEDFIDASDKFDVRALPPFLRARAQEHLL